MDKIRTIFRRDEQTKRVVPDWADGVDVDRLRFSVGTQKIDGTNVRLTVRNTTVVRVEARQNPSKAQKREGILTPWYRDIDYDFEESRVTGAHGSDAWIAEAVKNTKLVHVEDGEWPGEAVGPKIQGNPLNFPSHMVVLFSVRPIRNLHLAYEEVPLFLPHGEMDFHGIREFILDATPKLGTGPIEGLVFWHEDEPVGKIKAKDFAREVN